MKDSSILLDTSFFLRLFDPESALHQNAKDYFRYFSENGIIMKISTIAIAEFCVKGELLDLPLLNLQVVPFNILHATRAGALMSIVHDYRKTQPANSEIRNVVINDIKMFAQADVEASISGFISSDIKATNIYQRIKEVSNLHFEYMDLTIPYTQRYSLLGF